LVSHPAKLRVCAVAYLNTAPLVWGLVHGPQRGVFDVRFELPSVCADQLRAGQADIGLVPVIEMKRQGLEMFPGCGIASRGPVRSILLVSKVAWDEVRTLAADSGSRTSVMLARIILGRRFGLEPEVRTRRADLDAMLAECDAALLIGDPALHVDPAALACRWMDLGEEWTRLTGLPMVFAVWAGRPGIVTPERSLTFIDSWRYGRERIDAIVAAEQPRRGLPAALIRRYLTEHIVFELNDAEYAGLDLYLQYATELESLEAARSVLA
jgi:predicted solute-binding protein